MDNITGMFLDSWSGAGFFALTPGVIIDELTRAMGKALSGCPLTTNYSPGMRNCHFCTFATEKSTGVPERLWAVLRLECHTSTNADLPEVPKLVTILLHRLAPNFIFCMDTSFSVDDSKSHGAIVIGGYGEELCEGNASFVGTLNSLREPSLKVERYTA